MLPKSGPPRGSWTTRTSTRPRRRGHRSVAILKVYFHYPPTHSSSVNLIECFFSILSKQGLAHGVQYSKQDLKELLQRFLASYNESCNPFTWTKGPEHLQRI